MAEIRLQPSHEQNKRTVQTLKELREQIQRLNCICQEQLERIVALNTQLKAKDEELTSCLTQQLVLMNKFEEQLNITALLHESTKAIGAKLYFLEAERGSPGYSLRMAPQEGRPGLDDAEETQEAANGLCGGEPSVRITE